MTRLSPFDELFVHQIPAPLAVVASHNHHWRESYFFDIHRPDVEGDVLFLTMATYPARGLLDSLQLGNIDGRPVLGMVTRDADGDPHSTVVGGVNVDIVRPFEEIRLRVDPAEAVFGLDVTFRARTRPYALRRGTMFAGADVVWDQSHMLQSGRYDGAYTVDGIERRIDGWVGQRDHSWGIRDHARCPLWMWLQLQFDDGFLGIWHWQLANGSPIYTDGCWAPTDFGEPVPVVGFAHNLAWVDRADRPVDYGPNGDNVAGLRGSISVALADGQSMNIDAVGHFARPYEPFHRGGLNLMKVRAADGRVGSAIYEVTGARHHHFFPDTVITGVLPS